MRITRKVRVNILLVGLVLVLRIGNIQTTELKAEALVDAATTTVEIPTEQLSEIQAELQYLRQRDAERQAWEESIGAQLSANPFSFASAGHEFDDLGAKMSQKAVCDGKGCVGGCCKNGSYPAPCIDCPHVPTLSPYFNIRVLGALKLDWLLSEARGVAPGTPYFLLPGSIAGLNQNTSDMHARQSNIGAVFAGPQIGSLQAGGMVLVFFYNSNALADAYGILPGQMWGDLKNEYWRFAAGYQTDVFNPGAPTVLPFSALCGSGNAGNAWRGQIRVERFLHPHDAAQWTLQFALSEPITTVIDPAFGLSEDNGWPNIEGRIALGLGYIDGMGPAAKRPVEVGVSFVVGQIRNTRLNGNNVTIERFVTDVWGLGTDFRWNINDFLGVAGELYTGQSLGTYNGSALQTVYTDNDYAAIRSSGGWCELFLYWTPCLHSHVGYGIDDPRDSDIPATVLLGRTENSTAYANLIWDISESFRVAVEVARRETNYRHPGVPNNDGNSVHTQFTWTF